jgi:hypothetical protein
MSTDKYPKFIYILNTEQHGLLQNLLADYRELASQLCFEIPAVKTIETFPEPEVKESPYEDNDE